MGGQYAVISETIPDIYGGFRWRGADKKFRAKETSGH